MRCVIIPSARKEVEGVTKKKKTSIPKNAPVWRLSAEEATLKRMPHYNAHVCKTGAHGDAKYNRARQKRAWKSELDREGACRSRLLPVCTSQCSNLPASSSPALPL